MKLFQLHLASPGMSGRGVRYRVLTPQEKLEVECDAARSAGAEATLFEIRLRTGLEGVKRMLVAYTDPGQDTLQKEGLVWHATSLTDLSLHGSGKSFADIFDPYPRDIEILLAAYTRAHDVKGAEIEEILGKELQVSAG